MEKRKPLISVVMPVKNGERYLREAIDSVLNQSCDDFELLAIDDGSSDTTGDILSDYEKKDGRILVVRTGGVGLCNALNIGLKMARGEYIARMDADDVSHGNRFEKQLEVMESTDASLCGCHFFCMNDERVFDAKFVPLSHDFNKVWLMQDPPFAGGSVMIRKKYLIENGLEYGMDGMDMAEDYSLWVRMAKMGAKFVHVDDFLFKYRVHKNSVSHVKASIMKKNRILISKEMIRENKDWFDEKWGQIKRSVASDSEGLMLARCTLIHAIANKKLIALWRMRQFSLGQVLSAIFNAAKYFKSCVK